MPLYPVSIALRPDHLLEIRFNDEIVLVVEPNALRKNCPCASCKTEHDRLESIKPSNSAAVSQENTVKNENNSMAGSENAESLRIERMRPVGNYAYEIAFSDGHSTGIFPIALLRALGQPA